MRKLLSYIFWTSTFCWHGFVEDGTEIKLFRKNYHFIKWKIASRESFKIAGTSK